MLKGQSFAPSTETAVWGPYASYNAEALKLPRSDGAERVWRERVGYELKIDAWKDVIKPIISFVKLYA